MKKSLLDQLLRSLLASFLISAIGFILVFSFITGEFPPKISSIQRGLNNLKKLSEYSQTVLTNEVLLKKNLNQVNSDKKNDNNAPHSLSAEIIANDDLLIEELDRINARRMALGKKLMGQTTGESVENDNSKTNSRASAIHNKAQIASPPVASTELQEYLQLSQTQFEILYFELKALRSEVQIIKQIKNKNVSNPRQ